jgi:hypothetical protein
MDETLLYVHLAQAHRRPLPAHVAEGALDERDPDRRVLNMLGARVRQVPVAKARPWELRQPRRGKYVAKTAAGGVNI